MSLVRFWKNWKEQKLLLTFTNLYLSLIAYIFGVQVLQYRLIDPHKFKTIHTAEHIEAKLSYAYCFVQVNLFQKHFFLHQLTHNLTKDCSWIYQFRTWKLQTTQFVYTTCSEFVVFMYWTGKSMNNTLSYCRLVDARISASDKDLPVVIATYTHYIIVQIFWEDHKNYDPPATLFWH